MKSRLIVSSPKPPITRPKLSVDVTSQPNSSNQLQLNKNSFVVPEVESMRLVPIDKTMRKSITVGRSGFNPVETTFSKPPEVSLIVPDANRSETEPESVGNGEHLSENWYRVRNFAMPVVDLPGVFSHTAENRHVTDARISIDSVRNSDAANRLMPDTQKHASLVRPDLHSVTAAAKPFKLLVTPLVKSFESGRGRNSSRNSAMNIQSDPSPSQSQEATTVKDTIILLDPFSFASHGQRDLRSSGSRRTTYSVFSHNCPEPSGTLSIFELPAFSSLPASRARSSRQESAVRRLGIPPEPSMNHKLDEDSQPSHPFLRMYQTRPGAFARLLSRNADKKLVKVAPGSTIASLMDPHKSVVSEKRVDDEDHFQGTVQGETVNMKQTIRKKKVQRNFSPINFDFDTMDWRCQLRTLQRLRQQKLHAEKRDEQNDTCESKGAKGRLPKAKLHTLSVNPKQFILSSNQVKALLELTDRSYSSDTEVDLQREQTNTFEELQQLEQEMQSFSDMDYVLPLHLGQLLRQEGVDEKAVDSTLAHGKVWHDRAAFLNHAYQIKRRKYLARPSCHSSLPPIQNGRSRSRSKEPSSDVTPAPSSVEARREKRVNRQRPWTEVATLPSLPIINQSKTDLIPEGCKALDDLTQYWNEAQDLKWKAERQEEMVALPVGFVPPRLVLISSKIPRCQSMRKATRRGEKHILYIVYDFDTWSFQDILDAVRSHLNEYCSGCKAESILIMCQGGQGCLYILRTYVLTPQKMRRQNYAVVREFWKSLGEQVSKIKIDNTAIHLLGGQLGNEQGKQLLQDIKKSMIPNKVNLQSLDEKINADREAIELYFDFRKFLLWRSKTESQSLLDYTDVTRSWTSLAEDAEDMDTE